MASIARLGGGGLQVHQLAWDTSGEGENDTWTVQRFPGSGFSPRLCIASPGCVSDGFTRYDDGACRCRRLRRHWGGASPWETCLYRVRRTAQRQPVQRVSLYGAAVGSVFPATGWSAIWSRPALEYSPRGSVDWSFANQPGTDWKRKIRKPAKSACWTNSLPNFNKHRLGKSVLQRISVPPIALGCGIPALLRQHSLCAWF